MQPHKVTDEGNKASSVKANTRLSVPLSEKNVQNLLTFRYLSDIIFKLSTRKCEKC